MNRANLHLCPKLEIEDLRVTADSMLAEYLHPQTPAFQQLSSALKPLSGIYLNILNELSPRTDFFGARDFYSLVRFLIQRMVEDNFDLNKFNLQCLINAILRNFGGIKSDRINDLAAVIARDYNNITSDYLMRMLQKEHFRPISLITQNLFDTRSSLDRKNKMQQQKQGALTDNFIINRHVLVLTESAHSWQLLTQHKVLTYEDAEFIIGSEFLRDKSSNIMFYDSLSKIMNCMKLGKRVVLYNLDEIHESLYDMLNQRYTIHSGGKMYCRVVLRGESRTCYVERTFKCVVIVSKQHAYTNKVPVK